MASQTTYEKVTVKVLTSQDLWQYMDDGEDISTGYVGNTNITQYVSSINWVDENTIEVYPEQAQNNAYNWSTIIVSPQTSMDLYFRLKKRTPITKSDGNTTYILTYELDWKRTYVRRFFQNLSSYPITTTVLRNNVYGFNIQLNQDDPKLKKFENLDYKWNYSDLTFSIRRNIICTDTPESGRISDLVNPIMYYVIMDLGKFWLLPVLCKDHTRVKFGWRGNYVKNTQNTYWFNMNDRDLAYHSKNVNGEGFVGKFLGPNLWSLNYDGGYGGGNLDPDLKNFTGQNGEEFIGIQLRPQMFSWFNYVAYIDKQCDEFPSSPNGETYTPVHLRYLKGGMYNNHFNLPAMWVDNSDKTDRRLRFNINYSIVKQDGFYHILKNSGVGNQTDWTFAYSSCLPAACNNYLKWAQANEPQMKAQVATKATTAAILGLATIVMGVLTAGVSVPAMLGGMGAAIGGISSAVAGGTIATIGSAASAASSGATTNATINAKKDTMKGNVISGDGTEFAYLPIYLKNQDSLYTSYYVTQCQYMEVNQIKEINSILYYYGMYQPRVMTINNSISNGYAGRSGFIYYQFDGNDERLIRAIKEWVARESNRYVFNNAIKDVVNYVYKFLCRGIRVWGS